MTDLRGVHLITSDPSDERGSSAYTFLGVTILVICAIGAIAFFPWNQMLQKQDVNYVSAVSAISGKQFERAIPLLEKSIQSNPKNALAYVALSKAYAAKGDLDKALESAEKAVQLGATNPVTYAQRGFVFKLRKDPDKAIADASKAISMRPNFAEAYRLRAWVYNASGKCKEALVDFQQVDKIRPGDPASIQDKAWFLMTCKDEKLQDTGKALEMAKKAFEMSGGKKDGVFLETLAEAYFRQGDYLKAADYQKKAVAIEAAKCPDGACVKDMKDRLQKYELAARAEERIDHSLIPLN